MSHRIEQVNQVLKENLGQLILTEVDFPQGCLATITRVETSKDIRHATVFISVIPGPLTGKALTKLNKSIGRIQFLLNKRLRLKPLPRIRFAVDQTEQHAGEIDAVLNSLNIPHDDEPLTN